MVVEVNKHAKMAMGVQWSIDQLLNKTPPSPDALSAHARMIKATMVEKKVKLPSFILAVLNQM